MEDTIKALFSKPFGGGYPASEAQRKIEDSIRLKEMKKKSQYDFSEFIKNIDSDTIEKINRKISVMNQI